MLSEEVCRGDRLWCRLAEQHALFCALALLQKGGLLVDTLLGQMSERSVHAGTWQHTRIGGDGWRLEMPAAGLAEPIPLCLMPQGERRVGSAATCIASSYDWSELQQVRQAEPAGLQPRP